MVLSFSLMWSLKYSQTENPLQCGSWARSLPRNNPDKVKLLYEFMELYVNGPSHLQLFELLLLFFTTVVGVVGGGGGGLS